MFDLALLENDQAVSSAGTYTHTVTHRVTNSLFQACMELHGIVIFLKSAAYSFYFKITLFTSDFCFLGYQKTFTSL